MPTLLTVTGRDVLFAHWPVDPDALAPVVPDPLEIDTYDGSAWVSALALENPGVAPGSLSLPEGLQRGFPQLNFRTYVALDGEPGVYFLSLDSGRRLPARVGRNAFGLPFHHARMRLTRRGDEVTFRSRRRSTSPSPAVFQARYRPSGEPSRVEPGSLAEFCIERVRYYLPVPEDRRSGPLQSVAADPDGVYAGTVERDPWRLQPVTADLRTNTLFEAAGLRPPSTAPAFQYSPGFEMHVRPLDPVSVGSAD